jgi:hypothetical protein
VRSVRSKVVILVLVVVPALLGACGSSKASTPTATTAPAVLEVAGPEPSVSAKMICADEAKNDIAAAVGVDTVRPLVPKWRVADHVYSCVFAYSGGPRMVLSVKEMSSPAETTAYFDSLATKLGRTKDALDLGEGAFKTANGSVVVRKDYRVLLVDAASLPVELGKPPLARAAFASTVASIIMLCWTGA